MGILKGVVCEFLTARSPTLSSASRNPSKQIPPLLEAANLRLWVKFASAYSREQFLSLHRLLALWLVAAVAPLGTHFPRCNPLCHPPGDHQLQSYGQKQLERVTQIHRTVAPPRETLAPRYSVPCAQEEKDWGWEERWVDWGDGPFPSALLPHTYSLPPHSGTPTQRHTLRPAHPCIPTQTHTYLCSHTHAHPHKHVSPCSHMHTHKHKRHRPLHPHLCTSVQAYMPLLPHTCTPTEIYKSQPPPPGT